MVFVVVMARAQTPATLTDFGTTAPTPGASDISQLSISGQVDKPDALNYYDDNQSNHSGGEPGQTFTTGSAAFGYLLNSLTIKTGGGGTSSTGTSQNYLLHIYSVSGSTATLLATYSAANFTFTDGHWLRWSNFSLSLSPNTSYAYSFGKGSAVTGYEAMGNAGGNLYSGGQLGIFPVAGGTITFSSSHNFDAVFDAGLTTNVFIPTDIWTAAASTNWDLTTANWTNLVPANTFTNGDAVLLNDTASAFTVNLTTNVSPSSMTFSNSANNYTIGSIGGFSIAGSGGLTLAGTGTVTLNNTNTFSGVTTIVTNGTLVIGGAGRLGGGTYAANITDNGTLNYGSTASQNITGIISGTGGLTLNAPVSTVLTIGPGTSSTTWYTYTGPTVVNSGELDFNFGNNPTSGIHYSSSLTINNGGTVKVLGSSALEGYTVTANNLPITINAGGTLTSANVIGLGCELKGVLYLNGGTLSELGTPLPAYGSWEINNQVNVNGGINTSTMSAQMMSPQEIGGTIFNITSGGTSQTIPGVDLLVTGTFTNSSGNGDTGIIMTGNGTMALGGGSNSVAHGTTIGSGTTLLLTNAATVYGPGVITNNGTFIDGSSSAQTLSGVISGTGAVQVTAAGAALTLNAADTFSGNTIISAGTLFLGASGSINNTPSISVAGGAAFDVSALAAFTLGGSQSLLGSGTNNGSITTTSGSKIYAGTAGGYGTNTFKNNLTFVSGSACYLDLGPTYNGANDQIVLNGIGSVLNCGGASIGINCGATLDQANDYALFNVTGASAGISGSFNPVPVWLGATPANAGSFSIVTLTSKVVLHYNSNGATNTPVVTNLPTSNIAATSVTLNGQLLSTGGQYPTVTIYYGLTNGGTNPAAWTTNVSLGLQAGSFGAAVSNLSPNATYYFAAAASNSVGTAWAQPSKSFTTLPIFPPVVTNLPATSVQVGSAVMNGQVVSIGNQIPTVTLYYGSTDGGTNAGAWSNQIVLGLQGGSFSYIAGGLSNNTTYYYTASATNLAGLAWAMPSASFTTPALQAVYTYHYDNARSGANTNETVLTPANVNTNSFGKLFTYTVDGYVYAQALIATNVTIPGKGTHNILYVATENDTVYAFDADNYVPTPYWTNSFINSLAGITVVQDSDIKSGYNNISPQAGITATPVIDPATGTIYAEAVTKEISGGITTIVHRLHALDISTGLERASYNSPMLIAYTNYPGVGYNGTNHVVYNGTNTLPWIGGRENARPALLLANGMVYICYSGFGDNTPYYGWVFSYDAHTLAQTGVFNTSPNSGWGAIWMSGNGAVADTNGNIYVNTGNGPYDANSDYGDSVIKLNGTNGLQLVDYFTPFNQAYLFSADQDVSAGGLLLLPPVNGTNLLLSGSKLGVQYLLNTANMGHYNASSDSQIVQEGTNMINGQWSSPAYFNGMLYYVGCYQYNNGGDVIKQFLISGTTINTNPVAQGTYQYLYPGATPVVSANGTNNAIVWALECVALSTKQAVLHAYNATNVAQEFYNSSQLSRDNPGVAVLFTLPTVANGKVYVGTRFGMSVFGLTTFIAPPVIVPAGGAYANLQTVALSDATAGATIYYTLDGTVPGTNSLLYSGPFGISNTVIVQAVAAKPGAVNSGVASASFVNTAAAGHGTGLQGQYWTNTAAAAFTNAGFATAATLTRTDAVVNFDWRVADPAPAIGTSNYTVRWTGAVQAQYNEAYTFTTVADDGVRLWVNGQLLVNDWTAHASPATNSGTTTLNSQQLYNLQMDYFQGNSSAAAQLKWSSASTASAIIPQTQLYPFTNPPPSVVITSPANGATNFTAAASVTIGATADAPYNPIRRVDFYTNNVFLASVSNSPYAPLYAVTATGLAAGSYTLMAVAVDGSGLSNSSAPMGITVTNGSGLAYGLTSNPPVGAFLNMPATFNGTLPALLSGTGAFSSTANRTVANGLIPYVPNTPLWSDAAIKSRYLALPNNGGVITPDAQIKFAPTNSWIFPAGTVFVKNFDLVVNETNASVPLRRLETRLLVRDSNGQVYGVTYKWRADNSDADLLPGSLNEAITITNASGVRTQTWYYPSPADCLTCHTPAANYVLGVNTRQLNGNQTYPATGNPDNQLRTLNRLGMFYPAINEGAIGGYAKLSALTNSGASLEERARSYLDANCAQCHTPLNGTGIHANFDARYDTPLALQNITNALATTSLGISDNACIVKSRDIWRSVLFARINTNDAMIKMPPLARNLIDTNAVQVFKDWINSLPGQPALAPPAITPNGGGFGSAVTITLTPPDGVAQLYYTTNGTLPTTNSFLYAAPFPLTNSATLMANAFEAGFNNSAAASAAFTVQFAPYFTAGSLLPNGQFQLGVAGVSNKTYILQASTNLINWIPLNTNTATTNFFNLTDPAAANFPYRFYRTLQQ
jgi:PA14 domain/Chitobiase/beta-hexosaminidase C-terminal domain